MPIPAAVPIALTVGSLLSGFFGGKKKKKEAKKVADTNKANDLKYRTDAAARQDAIDRGNVDVANQTSVAATRTGDARRNMALSLLSSMSDDTINKGMAGDAVRANIGQKPITYTAPPPNVVAPSNMEVDPSTGDTWDAFSKVFGSAASALTEKNAVDNANDEKKKFLDELKTHLWKKNDPTKTNTGMSFFDDI